MTVGQIQLFGFTEDPEAGRAAAAEHSTAVLADVLTALQAVEGLEGEPLGWPERLDKASMNCKYFYEYPRGVTIEDLVAFRGDNFWVPFFLRHGFLFLLAFLAPFLRGK